MTVESGVTVRDFSQALGVPMGQLIKMLMDMDSMKTATQTLTDTEVELIAVSGDVRGRDCVVVEDIITTGGTIAKLATALRTQGANKVLIAATHPVLTGDAVERLRKADVDEVIVTDSVPIPPEKMGPPLKILSVAPLLAEAIIRVHENRSVSELFR